MPEKRAAKTPEGRKRIAQIARELTELARRREELERERRRAMLSTYDSLLDSWIIADLRERRWNTEPPPIAAETFAS